ncbi:MAG TPA: hypothetical protein VGM33_25660 [Baekduia sp.]
MDLDEYWAERLAAACPLEIRVHETAARIVTPHEPVLSGLPLILECPVADAEAVTTGPSPGFYRLGPTGEPEPYPVAACPELDVLELRGEEIAGALSLLYDTPVSCGPVLGIPEEDNRLIPEGHTDEAVLERLNHPPVLAPMRGRSTESTVGAVPITGELVGRLAERPGIRVYWEARHAESVVASYRELWRTLELSFKAQGLPLRDALLSFPPAVELGFNADELLDHEVLRGRASHASGRLGHREAAAVHHLVLQRIGRLHALVERVLLARADDAGVCELVPFREDRSPIDFNRIPSEQPVRS